MVDVGEVDAAFELREHRGIVADEHDGGPACELPTQHILHGAHGIGVERVWPINSPRVAKVEQQVRAEGGQAFIFSPNYKISSLMRFYLPGQPRTYAQDIYGDKALQFDYFPLDDETAAACAALAATG